MWPETYAYEHSKDHHLANAISAGLADIDFQDLYVLRMPALQGESEQELQNIGRAVSREIFLKYASLKPAQVLRIKSNGYCFEFGIQPIIERDDLGATKGLCFS